MRPARWWEVRTQPDEPEAVNERDDDHPLEASTATGETVWCRPEAADHWDASVWRDTP